MKELKAQLKEDQTLGRRTRQTGELKNNISDTEDILALLEIQLKDWKKKCVEVEDAWIPRCIGLITTVPYHYLLRDWLLAVIVACSGGIDHPGMSLGSLRLEWYALLMSSLSRPRVSHRRVSALELIPLFSMCSATSET